VVPDAVNNAVVNSQRAIEYCAANLTQQQLDALGGLESTVAAATNGHATQQRPPAGIVWSSRKYAGARSRVFPDVRGRSTVVEHTLVSTAGEN
jgi:hypothetical protein